MKRIMITNKGFSIFGQIYEVEKEDEDRYYIRIMGTLMPIFKSDAEEIGAS